MLEIPEDPPENSGVKVKIDAFSLCFMEKEKDKRESFHLNVKERKKNHQCKLSLRKRFFLRYIVMVTITEDFHIVEHGMQLVIVADVFIFP